MDVEITSHASERLEERNIEVEQVKAVLINPERVVEDQGGTKVAQRRIERRGQKYLLRCVYTEKENGFRLITAYLTSKIEKYMGKT